MALLGFIFSPPFLERARLRSSLSFRRLFFHFLLFGFILGASTVGRAQDQEYQLKAAFLYNFAQFVKWPSGAFTSSDAPFNIGVLGDDPFGSALEETVRGEAINNHRLTVVRAQQVSDLKDCQMIFVSRSKEGQVSEILSQLDSKPILTVSEIDNFAQDGGAIDFYLQGGKVRFEINPNSAQRRGLKISSQLLNLGKIVAGGN